MTHPRHPRPAVTESARHLSLLWGLRPCARDRIRQGPAGHHPGGLRLDAGVRGAGAHRSVGDVVWND